jgi:class 3 adenylate cyclase/pimeloyl-ACP methyl ester carboxylesterase
MPTASAPPQTSYALSDAGYVAYQSFGDGPNPVLFVPSWLQNLDVMWDEPTLARYLGRLASFAKVVAFDKRGTGVSDPVALHALPTIEQWMDDAKVALDAAGIDRTALIGDTEGGPIAAMFAATYPERVTALVLVNTFARWRRDHDYPIGMPDETVTRLTDLYEQHWGVTPDILELTAPSAYRDPRFRAWYLRYQRLCMPRGAAAAMYRWVTDLDVRSVLGSIHAPTLVVSRSGAQHHRPAFGRYLADHIPDARYVELPGADTYPFQTGDFDQVLDQVEQFLTGSEPAPKADRLLGTIVFTDIVASTQVVSKIGDSAWIALRRTHDELVRENIRRYRGREVSHTGDGFLALFDGPARAVTCAASIVEQVRDLGIEIRVGVHTGEVELIGDQIGGVAVHLASRILDEAGPGTILASSTVKELVLGSGIGFIDQGPRQLKGMPDTWRLFQVTNVP